MKIQNMKIKCAFGTTETFVRKTGVTKYSKIPSLQYQLSDRKLRLSAKILNESHMSRCTYYWLEPKPAASFRDYMPVQAVWHEHRYLSCQYNVTSKTLSSQVPKHRKNLTMKMQMSSGLSQLCFFFLSLDVFSMIHQCPGRYNRFFNMFPLWTHSNTRNFEATNVYSTLYILLGA